jgi:hypothetical protein
LRRKFNEPHQACVGQRHWHALVPTHQPRHRRRFGIEQLGNAEHTALGQLNYGTGISASASDQERCFRKNRFAGYKRRTKTLELRFDPCVMSIVGVKERDNRPGINDDACGHDVRW